MSAAYPISITSNSGADQVALTVSENTMAVTKVVATSGDISAAFSYAIVGGDDAARFTIDRVTGVLHFLAPTDYENPTNATVDSDLPYLVTVRASDGSQAHDISFSVTVSDSASVEGTGDADALVASDAGTIDAELFGFEGKDLLTGGAGNDLLDGGAGADRMMGDLGDDLYIVDSSGDKVVENSDGGNDTVQTGLRAYRLGANVENLVFINTGSIPAGHTGHGNALDNTIIGSTGNDVLSGLAGNDHLLGGDGRDTLFGGKDNDWLDGGTGADQMIGGAGDDNYVVENARDKVVEGAGDGNDTVFASINYTLATAVENLVLTGSDDLTGTGSRSDNVLIGNLGVNNLAGGAGNDTIDGGLGLDTLIGGNGADKFRFGTDFDGNADVIVDFARSQGDKIVLDMSIFTAFTSAGAMHKAAFYAAADATAAPATDAGADVLIIYNKTSGALYYDADGSGTNFDAVQFAQIGASNAASHATLTYSDFLIVA